MKKLAEDKELIFITAKIIAESDSIGEGHGYCPEYTHDMCSEKVHSEYRDNAIFILKLIDQNLEDGGWKLFRRLEKGRE